MRLLEKNPPEFQIEEPGSEQHNAFLALKKALTSFPVLRLPDFTKTFYVMTDASIIAVGAMLAQVWSGYEHPVAYYSKSLLKTQRMKHPYELETYACIMALRAFRHYITLNKFIVVTDCRALAHFNSTREVSAKIVRWMAELSQYGVQFMHRKGELNVFPDMFSRDEQYTEPTENEMKVQMANQDAPLHLLFKKEGMKLPVRINRTLEIQNEEKQSNSLIAATICHSKQLDLELLKRCLLMDQPLLRENSKNTCKRIKLNM